MEVALDLALQASPDHPWVKEHPEWFTTRADGTIAYAENPPKKYQDIYPINFDNDPEGIYAEVAAGRAAVDGPRGADLPGGQPAHQAAGVLGAAAGRDPRAPTRTCCSWPRRSPGPAMMHALAMIGFHQSYTYFTWRNTRRRADRVPAGAVRRDAAAYMRPNFFVNTPDILHEYLQHGGPPAFKIRAVLAAMLSPTWGIYSGYELCENIPVRPGSEEYLDSEKYQYRPRDWEPAARDGRRHRAVHRRAQQNPEIAPGAAPAA